MSLARPLSDGRRRDRSAAPGRGREAGAPDPPRARPVIAKIVAGWPQNFDAKRATALGFEAEKTFDEIIRIHIEDELGGKIG